MDVVAQRKRRAREEWVWTIRRGVRDWKVLKYLGSSKNNQISAGSEIRMRACDFVVMLTSHPVRVTHRGLVTKRIRKVKHF